MRRTPHGADESGLIADQEAARQFLRIDRHRHRMRSLGMLHTADLRLLWLLCYGPPQTLREISETFNLEQSTVNRQVNTAIRNGLVERLTEEGRSAKVVAPTSEGRRRFEADSAQSLGIYRAALDHLGDDRETFVRLFARFVDGFSASVDDHLSSAQAADGEIA